MNRRIRAVSEKRFTITTPATMNVIPIPPSPSLYKGISPK